MAEEEKSTSGTPIPTKGQAGVVPPPCLLVIFGASGDLTKRKLVPALFGLFREGLLPGEFAVLGVSRTPFSDDAFRDHLRDGIAGGSQGTFDQSSWDAFAGRIFYQSGDIGDPESAKALGARIRAVSNERGIPGNSSSTPPSRRSSSPPSSGGSGRRGFPPPRRKCPATGESSSRSRSATIWKAHASFPATSWMSSGRTRSTGSTTTWERRRSRTSWSSASPTVFSSRCGTGITSTTCRSRWRRISAWRGGEIISRRRVSSGT